MDPHTILSGNNPQVSKFYGSLPGRYFDIVFARPMPLPVFPNKYDVKSHTWQFQSNDGL